MYVTVIVRGKRTEGKTTLLLKILELLKQEGFAKFSPVPYLETISDCTEILEAEREFSGKEPQLSYGY